MRSTVDARARALIGGTVVAVAVASRACGGAIDMGFDDSGAYHLGDGATWTVGGGCVGWDTSHIQDGAPACDPDAQGAYDWSNPNDVCQQWLTPPELRVPIVSADPLSAALAAGCAALPEGGGACSVALNNDWVGAVGFVTPCVGGDAGDAYCQGFWQQFITHGRSLAGCEGEPGTNGACVPDFRNQCPLNTYLIPVQLDDGGVECDYPCEP